MFSKQREALEANKKYQKVKLHLQEHREAYLAAAGASAVTAMTMLLVRRPQSISPVFNNTVAPIMNNIGNQVVNNIGHCCKIVQDVETKKLWPTATSLAMELAEEHAITFDRARWLLSRHTNGAEGYETLFGKKYVNYGVTTTG